MASENILFSSLIFSSPLKDYNNDSALNICEISSTQKSKKKKVRKQKKNKKKIIKKGRVSKKKCKKSQTYTKLLLEPILTSTPIKDDLYKVEKIRDTSNDYLESSPIKEIAYLEDISYNIFDNSATTDYSFINSFHFSQLIEPTTELVYEYENSYQIIYKVVDNDKLEFIAKRYYPYAKYLKSDKKNNTLLSTLDISQKNLKSALKKKDGPKKLFSVKFPTFISKEKFF
ncbi:Hypothetical protein SRAE_2000199200 [Strongyloides ratti]|uniref:Uncharacterized protein n=1 Tax=Strongyloides ratti TaxID=34506 RepID=A0A090LGT0_STRRB|nr:Hypothetical protein SRAE_2000199200 [Strongyloides ratti]CEF67328.1 Hypothetical protein SRAE_2000199200 [Strongyloides ratti]